jgi:RNA polymerase sigma-70 factor (ECF subfamily)
MHLRAMKSLSAANLRMVDERGEESDGQVAIGHDWGEEFEQRFAELRDRLRRVVASLVGGADAEDVVHDTYLIARRRLTQLRDPAALEAWLFRIAINTSYSRKRRERSETEALPKLARIVPAPAERDTALIELVERLPASERTLVVLHYGHGYHLDEIGQLVGLTAGAVKAKLFRARRRLLRQLLEASDD